MWIADKWKDYELLDCGGGEKLERWGDQLLVRPDPQAIWDTPQANPAGGQPDAAVCSAPPPAAASGRTSPCRSSWTVRYGDLTFKVKPMNFKHTGLFPEQAANWDFAMEQIRTAGRPIRVLNLFAYTGGATVACAAAGASVCHVDAAKGMVPGPGRTPRAPAWRRPPSAGSWTTAPNSWSGRSAGAGRYDAIIMDPPSYGRGPTGRGVEAGGEPVSLRGAVRRGAVGRAPVRHPQLLYHRPCPLGAGLSSG